MGSLHEVRRQGSTASTMHIALLALRDTPISEQAWPFDWTSSEWCKGTVNGEYEAERRQTSLPEDVLYAEHMLKVVKLQNAESRIWSFRSMSAVFRQYILHR